MYLFFLQKGTTCGRSFIFFFLQTVEKTMFTVVSLFKILVIREIRIFLQYRQMGIKPKEISLCYRECSLLVCDRHGGWCEIVFAGKGSISLDKEVPAVATMDTCFCGFGRYSVGILVERTVEKCITLLLGFLRLSFFKVIFRRSYGITLNNRKTD